MKSSLTLFTALVLSLSPFTGFSPGCSSHFAWICNGDKKPVLPEEEQHPVETRTSNWACWFGLTTCPIRSENGDKKPLRPEEQLPVDTQHHAFNNWRCWLGLSTCHVTTKDGDQKMGFHKQPLCINNERRASTLANWPCQLCLSKYTRWIWKMVSKVVPPKGPKLKVSSLHVILGHRWANLVQRWGTWILIKVLEHICILWLLRIACCLWRRVRRPWRQETGPTASASITTEHGGKDDTNVYDSLCWMETRIEIMEKVVSSLLQLHLEDRKTRQRMKRLCADYRYSIAKHARSTDRQQERQQCK